MKKDVDENWKINMCECSQLGYFVKMLEVSLKNPMNSREERTAISILLADFKLKIKELSEGMPKEYLRKI